MNAPNSVPSAETGEPQPSPWRGIFTDAIGYWERGRIGYNLILAAVVISWNRSYVAAFSPRIHVAFVRRAAGSCPVR